MCVGNIKSVQRFRFVLILFRDDSFMRGQPPISVTGHWRILSYVRLYNYDDGLDNNSQMWLALNMFVSLAEIRCHTGGNDYP